MCGFAGILNKNGSITETELLEYANMVKFRGPDAGNVSVLNEQLTKSCKGPHGFFFNRLAIVDLNPRSNQPFENESFLLLFNGEIYNYLSLKQDLIKKNIQFQTTSDTEVLFYGLISLGIDFVPLINGMFSFFFLNKQTGVWICGRDRSGIKPFYYSFDKGSFAFGSEIASIIRLKGEEPRIDKQSVKTFLSLQYTPSPYTIYENVHSLQAGYCISGNLYEKQAFSPKKYWDAYLVSTEPKRNTQLDLECLLKDSIKSQLMGDVPLGLFLSGGVDSSLIAAVVNKHFGSDQIFNFFTVGFKEKTRADESYDAIDFLSKFKNPNFIHTRLEIDESSLSNLLDQFYTYYDQPFGDSAALLNWAIAKKARSFVTVALSGDGADELFWGYTRYADWKKIELNAKYNPMAKLNQNLQISEKALKFNRYVSLLLEGNKKRAFIKHLAPTCYFEHSKAISETNYFIWENIETIKKAADYGALLDFKSYLPDAMLYKVDRASMAVGLEARVPFLDNNLIDYALNTSLKEKSTNHHQHKAPLKDLLSKLAPWYDINKPKSGFHFPISKWMKGSWKERIIDTIQSTDLSAWGLSNQETNKMLCQLDKNEPMTEYRPIWHIFHLCLWAEQTKSKQ